MKSSIKQQFYKNDMVETPKKMSATTKFRSPLLKKIYMYIDSTEISIFDSHLVTSRN